MRIERLYYTEACEQMKEIENQARKIYGDLTDEEKVKEDREAKERFERLIATFTRRIQTSKSKHIKCPLYKCCCNKSDVSSH